MNTYVEKRVPITSCMGKLPIGIVFTDTDGSNPRIVRNITYRKISHNDIKRIHDREYMKSHPFKWAAMVMSTVVDNIGGVPVWSEFESGKMKYSAVPDIVKQLSNGDITFILFCGHIFNFGTPVNEIESVCTNCEKTNKKNIDLKNVEVVRFVDENDKDFDMIDLDIKLEDGYRFKSSEDDGEITYTNFVMDIPTLGAAIKYESLYQPNNQGPFYEKVYGDLIKRIYGDKGEIDANKIKMIGGVQIFNNITASDSRLIEKAINEAPRTEVALNEVCDYCSKDMDIIVTGGFLYPRR